MKQKELYLKTFIHLGPLIRLCVSLEEKSFKITLISEDQAYYAHVSEEEIQRYASLHNLGFNEYYTTLQRYLGEECDGIQFNFQNNVFLVLRHIVISSKFFSISLEELLYSPTVVKLLDNAKVQYQEAVNKNKEVEATNSRLEKELAQRDKLLRESAQKHKAYIKKLYQCFQKLLHEKKCIIRDLKRSQDLSSSDDDEPFASEHISELELELSDDDLDVHPYTSKEKREASEIVEKEVIPIKKSKQEPIPSTSSAPDFFRGSPSPPPVPKRIKSKSKSKFVAEQGECSKNLSPSIPSPEASTSATLPTEEKEDVISTQDLLDRF